MYFMDLEEAAEGVLGKMKNRKVISPRVHGFIDYGHAAFFLTMGFIWRAQGKKAASAAALGTGAFVLLQSLATDYPLGVVKWIPFEAHGWMDKGFAGISWAVPRVFGFAGTPEATVFEGNSVVEGTVVGMTDWSNAAAPR